MTRKIVRFTAIIIIVVLLIPTVAMAADTRASAYLTSYMAVLTPIGNGKIRITIDVTATDIYPMVGAMSVAMSTADGSPAGYFEYTDIGYEGLMGYNTFTHDYAFIFQGTPGVTYAALIKYYAADANGSDYKFYVSRSVTAT